MDFINRVIIGVILAAFMVAVIIFRGALLVSALILFGIGAAIELSHAFKSAGRSTFIYPALFLVLASYPCVRFMGEKGTLALLFLVLSLQWIPHIFSPSQYKVEDVMASILLTTYIGCPIIAFASIACIENTDLQLIVLVLALFIPVLSDTFSYFSGKMFGKHKLTPISPKKTIEGFIFGTLLTIVGALIIGIIFNSLGIKIINLWMYPVIGTITALMSPVGDLSASAIKRYAGIKDYSHVFGNHGGFLDRLDSIFMSVLTVYIMMIILGL